jgi:outer membrane protein assembly factor BamB
MRRTLVAAWVAACWAPAAAMAAYPSPIVPQPEAARHGLTRAWHVQVDLDRGQGRVSHVVLAEDAIYVQTTRSVIHAISAETGESLWSSTVGRHDRPSLTPDVSKDLLATINGSHLYVVNRYNGDLLNQTKLDGAAGAGPGLSEKRAYVAMIGGLVVAYRLDPITDPSKELGIRDERPQEEQEAERRENIRVRQDYIPPLSCQGIGRAMIQPLVCRETVAEEYIAWPTERGFLNIGLIDRRQEDRFAVKYRLVTDAPISARPTYSPADPKAPSSSGVIYAASEDGFVYAVREKGGETLWRFSAGEPMIEPAVVIDDRVYAATQLGGMYAIDAEIGRELWWAPGIKRFLAASKLRVYAEDKTGRLLILNAETGQRLDSLSVEHLPIKVTNSRTDRLYLASDTGLVQCLHEIELREPIRHNVPPEEKPERQIIQQPLAGPAPGGQPGAAQPGDQPPAAGGDPFGAGGDPFGGGGDPFGGGGADAPFGGGGGAPDPFGGGAPDPFGGGGAAPPDEDDEPDDGNAGGGADPFGGGADPFGGGGAGDPFD